MRVAALLLAATLTACGSPGEPPRPATRLDVSQALGPASVEGFRRALEPRPFRFPRDHGPHPDYRTEWWYLTGNLETGGGRHFGYQATFFRTALTASPADRTSDWATAQLYMAHFAITDTAAGSFHSFERFSRGALGLAGAAAEPFRVWLEDWELAAAAPPDAAPLPDLRLRLRSGDVGVELTLSARKPLALHGDRGLSRKGAAVGNASYYYSATRLESRGSVHVDGREHRVEGTSWMDREWSTSLLEEGTRGWDWFALQLDDGSDLMLFELRDSEGRRSWASGTLVNPQGATRTLEGGEFELQVLDRWRSPSTGSLYPSRWLLELPGEELELEVRPRIAAQELTHTFAYWEGAVTAEGRRGTAPSSGRGYVELTGYGDASSPR